MDFIRSQAVNQSVNNGSLDFGDNAHSIKTRLFICMLKSGPSSILFLCFFLTTVQYAVFFYFLSLNRTWYELPFFNFWWFGKSVVADYPVNSTMICTSSSYRTNVVITSKMVLKNIEITNNARSNHVPNNHFQ